LRRASACNARGGDKVHRPSDEARRRWQRAHRPASVMAKNGSTRKHDYITVRKSAEGENLKKWLTSIK
jgi:hypothetical protein